MLFNEAKRKRMKELNRKIIEEKFTFKNQGQCYLDLFEQLTGKVTQLG